jgi:pSer/pThr/pTyr-binding forkhead associated (FHA) protein
MAKLTLTFKGKRLQTISLDAGSASIGRDPSNALQIDSLAVAPQHAVVVSTPEGRVIRSLRDDLPLLFQGRRITEHKLSHGDYVAIGKHTLLYTEDEFNPDVTGIRITESNDPEGNELSNFHRSSFEGSFQVMNGKQIGLVIPLKKALTRLGREGAGVAVVAKRKEGFFISPLAEETHLTVNGAPVNDEAVLLNDGDIVKINNSLLQFFQEKNGGDPFNKPI